MKSILIGDTSHAKILVVDKRLIAETWLTQKKIILFVKSVQKKKKKKQQQQQKNLLNFFTIMNQLFWLKKLWEPTIRASVSLNMGSA